MQQHSHDTTDKVRARAWLAFGWAALSCVVLVGAMVIWVSDVARSELADRERAKSEQQRRLDERASENARFLNAIRHVRPIAVALKGPAPELAVNARDPAIVEFSMPSAGAYAGCSLTAEAYGDLTSELVHIRSVSIECEGKLTRPARGFIRGSQGEVVAGAIIDRRDFFGFGPITLAVKPGTEFGLWLKQ